MTALKRGVLYIAWGKAHVDVARRSAASVKASNPELGTAIWCHEGDDTSGFDQAFFIPDGLARPKVDLLPDTPFDETLYMDNDTIVRDDLGSLFDLLQKFEICGAHVQLWHRPRHNKRWKYDVPETFPEINCGVLLYRSSDRVFDFFRDWSRAFVEAGFRVDQVTFRELLWMSDIQFYVFPPQFNKRLYEASELIYSDQPRARILHLELLRPQKNPILRWLSNRVR
ncbi:hypothetical protein [Tropicibacter naphthalenivorans]|uniref:Nucleotide-diphospho-sugar transferase domain-containing protein n=1 Tax=Tropicibacter naphthalenivorans TaxID=441103 RepID=A0A0P1GAW2_9RHOB|nr:hypothetical protein [Tropicibacter naphthalenivorans]CUH78507.1 hypothetical protein TRN7648_02010 [Tropicibacter naphthalenivorans]SMC80810.1 hypothetical protein SAMN04488093_104172 [Tropicibacter naphthalenivorans]